MGHEIGRRNELMYDVLSLTSALVRVPSENPPGETKGVCDVIESALDERFSTWRIEPEPGVTSLVAELDLGGEGRTLVLNGHVDVVPVGSQLGEWTHDPYAGNIVGNRLYGRGSLDMKGAVAALVVAANKIARHSGNAIGKLVVAIVADEESGGRLGAGQVVADSRFRGDAVLVAEPSDGGICVAHRGMCFVSITTHGRSAHASMPEEGINAVDVMIDVLTELRDLKLTFKPHPLLRDPSIVLGTTIHGGSRPNVVPASCNATIDVRKIPGMTDESVLADIREHLTARQPSVDLDISIVASGEAAETPPNAEILEIASDAFERRFRHIPERRGMAAASDGWWFANHRGLPTIMAFGPGRIADCHIVDESVDIEELLAFADIYEDVARTYLSG